MNEVDEVTIRLAAKKDDQAFRRLYDHYAGFVWKVIFRTVNGDKEWAREIVQETFIRVYASLKSFSYKSALSTWIYRIAFNTAYTYVKQNKRGASSFDPETIGHDGNAHAYENEEMVRMVLSALSEEERFLLTSREVEGIPFEELSLIVGRSSESLRTQMSRMKEKLRDMFEERFFTR
jgi:RNA polymerase sigma factor (sigma-70 family)